MNQASPATAEKQQQTADAIAARRRKNAKRSAATFSKSAYVEVDVDVTIEEILDTVDHGELINQMVEDPAIKTLMVVKLREANMGFEGFDIEAEKAYIAMHRGDTETVRAFVCECAGRIA